VNAREEAAYRCQYLWRSVLEQALIDAFGGTRNNGLRRRALRRGRWRGEKAGGAHRALREPT
jgi:hypothetical protein